MKLCVFSIVLDGFPWLPGIFTALQASRTDWQWIIVEGVAKNVLCSSHCRELEPRLSQDGTGDFLDSIASHPRVKIIRSESWDGKIAMCNRALEELSEPCLLMQIDSDECWRPDQLELLAHISDSWIPGDYAKFYCRYFVGPNIITQGEDCYGNMPYEWVRAWSWQKGMKFKCHCPPTMDHEGRLMSREETKSMGLVFDHYAYVTQDQIRFKTGLYGYGDTIMSWIALQQNRQWPIKLNAYLPWVDDKVEAIKLC